MSNFCNHPKTKVKAKFEEEEDNYLDGHLEFEPDIDNGVKRRLSERSYEPPKASLHEALVFLYSFHAQVLTGLNELRVIKQEMDEEICCFKDTSPQQWRKVKDEERFCSQVFEKMRARLCTFMENRGGIQIE